MMSASALIRFFSSFDAFSFFSISAMKARASLPSNTGVASIGLAIVFFLFMISTCKNNYFPRHRNIFPIALKGLSLISPFRSLAGVALPTKEYHSKQSPSGAKGFPLFPLLRGQGNWGPEGFYQPHNTTKGSPKATFSRWFLFGVCRVISRCEQGAPTGRSGGCRRCSGTRSCRRSPRRTRRNLRQA